MVIKVKTAYALGSSRQPLKAGKFFHTGVGFVFNNGNHLLAIYHGTSKKPEIKGVALTSAEGKVQAGVEITRMAPVPGDKIRSLAKEWDEGRLEHVFEVDPQTDLCYVKKGHESGIKMFIDSGRDHVVFFEDVGSDFGQDALALAWSLAVDYMDNFHKVIQGVAKNLKKDFKKRRYGILGKLAKEELYATQVLPWLFGGKKQTLDLKPLDSVFWTGKTAEELLGELAKERENKEIAEINDEFEYQVLGTWNYCEDLKNHLFGLFLQRLPVNEGRRWARSGKVFFDTLPGVEEKDGLVEVLLPELSDQMPAKVILEPSIWQDNVNWLEVLSRLSWRGQFTFLDTGEGRENKWFLADKNQIESSALRMFMGNLEIGGKMLANQLLLQFSLPSRIRTIARYSGKFSKFQVNSLPRWQDFFWVNPLDSTEVRPYKDVMQRLQDSDLDFMEKKPVQNFIFKSCKREEKNEEIPGYDVLYQYKGEIPKLPARIEDRHVQDFLGFLRRVRPWAR